MAMSPKLLRPRASLHPEAAAWSTAVVANGGIVSGSTLSAVDKFCKAIDAAGIRDRFYRLNLFCGTGLSAALVPLYRGPSRTGTQHGNTTDTNVNFVSGDYSETDGLLGSPAGKYLKTGLSPDTIGVSTGHISMVAKGAAASGTAMAVGSRNTGATQRYELATANRNAFQGDAVQDFYAASFWGGTAQVTYQQTGNATRPAGQYLLTRTASNRADWYLNGVSLANSTSSVTPGANANEFYVHARNGDGTASFFGLTTMRGYSLGLSMTSTQVAAFSNAFAALNTALGRS